MDPRKKQELLSQGYVFAHGLGWKPRIVNGVPIPRQPWEIERECFLGLYGLPEKKGYLGKVEHFKRMASALMGHSSMTKPFQWNPNACKILDAYFANDFLAIAGHASSSKTETVAVIAITEFMVDPQNTGVLVASTTIPEARGRIWGRIEYYWNYGVEDLFTNISKALSEIFRASITAAAPGELISSSAMIRFRDMDNGKKDDTRGIKLLPGKESEVKEGIGRMKGFKAPRMRVFFDEMSDLSHKLLDAAETNLYVNPEIKVVGCFNPASHFDPAGVFSEPIDGWDSVNVLQSDGWKTHRGWCIRFDGLSSPNVVAGENLWDGLLTKEKLEDRMEKLGNNSTRFMEQYRGCWSATGHADGIYSEAEIIKYRAQKPVDVWLTKPTMCCGFDPAFAHGGDRAVAVFCKTGQAPINSVGKPVIEVESIVYLDDDIDTTKDKKELIVQRLKEECLKRGMDAHNLGMDSTGGGDVLATLMSRDSYFGTKFLKVAFGAGGSELQSTDDHTKKGKDRYANMVSEIWYSGKSLLREEQLRGLKPSIVREMTQRLYDESGKPPKIRVESKENVKERLNGKSCDTGDAYFVACHVARIRLGLRSTERVGKSTPKPVPSDPRAVMAQEMASWGVKKKPRTGGVGEDEAAMASGGGWASHYDGGGVFDGTPFG